MWPSNTAAGGCSGCSALNSWCVWLVAETSRRVPAHARAPVLSAARPAPTCSWQQHVPPHDGMCLRCTPPWGCARQGLWHVSKCRARCGGARLMGPRPGTSRRTAARSCAPCAGSPGSPAPPARTGSGQARAYHARKLAGTGCSTTLRACAEAEACTRPRNCDAHAERAAAPWRMPPGAPRVPQTCARPRT